MWGDGYYAVNLKDKYRDRIKIIPDLWVLAGYFQPGRYNDATKFIKPTWELPRII
jgi:hypothetical protein